MGERIAVGVIGAAGRGGSLLRVREGLDVRVRAVCDMRAEPLAAAKRRLGAEQSFVDYRDMLASVPLDGVIVGTPMPFHAEQAIAALECGVSVLSEVPAAVSIDECRRLVAACRASSAVYVFAENYVSMRQNRIVQEIAAAGLFGTVYFGDGEYLHELRAAPRANPTPWRRRWQQGINGITYGTHSLGPLLRWMLGDRVERVACAGTGHHYRDHRGRRYEAEDSSVMLGRMRSGGLVKVRVDMLSDRPHATRNYQLQGTDGCYESARADGERDRIWVRARSSGTEWRDLEELAGEFLPARWRACEEAARGAGHGGGDLLQMLDFVDAVRDGTRPELGIDEAMDMTLPGLVSQRSIEQGGAWLEVPDSRDW